MLDDHNQGSTIVEVTIWMPLVLLVTVLMITMLLSILQQSGLHSGLVVDSVEEQLQEGSKLAASQNGRMEGDVRIYSEQSSVQLALGYSVNESVEQRLRVKDVEQRIRGWQLIGDTISE